MDKHTAKNPPYAVMHMRSAWRSFPNRPPGIFALKWTGSARAMSKNTEEIRTITGYIVPISVTGPEPTATVALAEGETEYHIEPRGAGIDLADQINVRVEARGSIREVDGVPLLFIRNYKLIDEFDSEWYDDDE